VQVEMEAGGAWVASNVGLMTLIDGETAEVVARVDVGGASSTLAASQAGATGYAVDGQAGTVVRVDPRTFAATPPIEVVPGAAGHMAAHAAERAVYVLDQDRGRVVVADPDDLAVREGRGASVADEVRSSVVDRRGRLWLLGATTGNLVAFDGRTAPRRVEHAVAHPDQAELVVAGGETVVVDRAAQRVRQLDGAGHVRHSACIDSSARDDTLRFGGAEHDALVFAVSGRQGVLRVSDLRDGGCSDVAIPVAAPGSELGDPVEHGGRVFVPNFSTDRVEVVDVERGSSSSTDEQVAAGHFQLFVVDGFVFFNDPESERAGVIHLDGSVAAVAKYDPNNPHAALDNDRLAGAARPEPAPAPPPPGADPAGDDQATIPPPPDAGGDPGAEGQPPPGAPGSEAPPPPGGRDQQQVPPPGGQPGSPPGTTAPPTTAAPTTAPPTSAPPTTPPPTAPPPTSAPPTTPPPTAPPPTAPPPNCGTSDADGDGLPDLCDGDDDNDGVPDESDACQGFNDHNNFDGDSRPDGCDSDDDNDGVPDGSDNCLTLDNTDGDLDGIPNVCDPHDDIGPDASIDAVTFIRDPDISSIMRVVATVTASDPESGVSTVTVRISGTYQCDTGDTFSYNSGPLVGTGGGTQTYSVSLQCGDSNRPPSNIHGQAWATAVNGDGEPGLVDPFLNF
jgi:hypothetical protein